MPGLEFISMTMEVFSCVYEGEGSVCRVVCNCLIRFYEGKFEKFVKVWTKNILLKKERGKEKGLMYSKDTSKYLNKYLKKHLNKVSWEHFT